MLTTPPMVEVGTLTTTVGIVESWMDLEFCGPWIIPQHPVFEIALTGTSPLFRPGNSIRINDDIFEFVGKRGDNFLVRYCREWHG